MADADADVDDAVAVPEAEEVLFGVEAVLVATTPPAGCVVGTVEGWRAVFQVAVAGQAVVATAGDAVPYGLGPGMSYVSSVW